MASSPDLNNSLSSKQIAAQGKGVTDSASSIDFGNISDTVVSKFILFVEAVIVLIVMFFVIHWVKKYIAKVEIKHEQQRTALNMVEKLLVGFVMVIGITIALKIIGIDISVLVGVGLIGLSYALKDIIQNYVAGILIFLKAPFKIGDIVKIKSYVGRVDKMEFQSTSLKTFDNRDITIYNSDIMSQSIENYSRHNMRRLEIDVNLGYGSDVQKITKIIGIILNNNTVVLKDPKFSISFKSFTNSSMIVQIKFWVPVPSNFLSVRSEIAWQINQAFDESTVFAPYERGFQTTNDFSITPERQNRIKEFYSNPLYSGTAPIATPAPTTAPALDANGQPIPVEVVSDLDEPQVE
jgi:small conductance mechanosensitive channel